MGIEPETPMDQLPMSYFLDQNYPNPFNPVTSITYNIEDATNVTIRIYDLLGHRVKTLVNEKKNPGSYLTLWDGLDQSGAKVASGFYICRLETDRFTATKKMLLLK
jgi:flagellar hook assembly protein FlgD